MTRTLLLLRFHGNKICEIVGGGLWGKGDSTGKAARSNGLIYMV